MQITWFRFFLALFFLISAFLIFFLNDFFQKKTEWETVLVERGKIEKKISANGTLNPVFTVNVGTQISGIIQDVHVDFNDKVTKSQLLAKIDPSLLEAKISQSKANLSAAEAVFKASKSKFYRQKKLEKKGFISKGSMENAEKEFEEASARVVQARAQLDKENRNLSYSKIISPIDGVIIERSIDVGQTVAASFQTPTLFKIARDLNEMQIEALVSEADIGNIRPGQAVTFEVDAFPNKSFNGTVKLVRLEPEVEQNVVSYKVIVDVENPEGTLLPGMTAQSLITVQTKNSVLKIPVSTLRFSPSEYTSYSVSPIKVPENTAKNKSSIDEIFRINERGKIEKLEILLGTSDGKFVEIVSGVDEKDEIITKEKTPKIKSSKSGFRFKFN